MAQQDGARLRTAIPTDLAFYNDRKPLKESARRLLREYSKVPEDEIDAHVTRVREEAFAIVPYPCIGMNRFLDLSILSQDVYKEVLERVKKGDKFLDLGCCFGQEIRQLVLDGAPPENLVGSDLKPEFFEMGYNLFGDKTTLTGTKFLAADVFDPENPLLKQYAGHFNIIYTGSFYHLFSLPQQIAVSELVLKLLKPVPGSLLVGRQAGRHTPGIEEVQGPAATQALKDTATYRHNAASWKQFWADFGERTGTRWQVDVVTEDNWDGGLGKRKESDDKTALFHGSLRLYFVARRL